MNILQRTDRVELSPRGINSLKNTGNANSAIPVLPGVGLMQRIIHITSCLAKTQTWSAIGVKAKIKKFTTKNLDIHEPTVTK